MTKVSYLKSLHQQREIASGYPKVGLASIESIDRGGDVALSCDLQQLQDCCDLYTREQDSKS
jgi:hypothetical protein